MHSSSYIYLERPAGQSQRFTFVKNPDSAGPVVLSEASMKRERGCIKFTFLQYPHDLSIVIIASISLLANPTMMSVFQESI